MLKWILPFLLAISLNANSTEMETAVDITAEYIEAAVTTSNTKLTLNKFLSTLTLGNDGFYNKVISPAKSLNLNLNDAARTQEINTKVINEMDAIVSVFKKTSEDKKLEAVKSIVNQIDPDIIKNGGANIQVINGSPSNAFSRTLIMIEKKSGNINATAEQLLKTFSSYKRSAIPSTFIYEYSDARNLSQSSIKTTVGTDLSWKLPQAAPEISANQDLVLKKCRQIFGWKCVTSIYQTGQFLAGEDNIKYFYAGIYDLANNQDHSGFSQDRRSMNQITGSTALYIIKESAGWILLYGVDSQWNVGAISFATLIQDEFLKDAKRIKERISIDLKVSANDIR